jgi:hypothetical protein
MRTTAQRIGGGEPLRAAMAEAGIGLQELARRTKLADPDGEGRSYQLLGFLTQDKAASRHARPTCTPATAALIEDALGKPRGSLFEEIEAPSRSDAQPGWDDLKNVTAQ